MLLDVALNQLSLVPPFLRAPAFAVLFWWLVLALGQRLLRLLRVPLDAFDVWEKGLLCLAIGAGTVQYLPFALGLFGALTPSALRISCALLVLVLSRDLLRVARSLGRALGGLSVKGLSRPALIWGALFALVMAMLLTRALVIGDMGDDDGYHLSSPKRWLVTGTLGYLPTYTNTNASMGFEMLYAIGMALCDAVGAKLLHYSAGLFALFGLVLSARRFSSTLAGLTAVSLLLIATPVANLPFLFGVAYVDLGACWMATTSILVWLVWREYQHKMLLVCLALCAGFAGSFKVTALSVAIAWLPAVVADVRRRGASWAEAARSVIGFGVVALAPVLPWLLRNLRLTGNPMYPMLSSVIPTRDWSAEQAHVFARYMRYYAWGLAAGARLGEEQRKLILVSTIGVILIAGGAALWLIKRAVLRSLVLCTAILAVISVGSTGLVVRYFMPPIMFAALVLGALLAERWSAKPWRCWPVTALMALAFLIQAKAARGDWSGHQLLKDARVAFGLSTLEEAYPNDPLSEMWTYVNAHTQPDAHVLISSFYTTFGASSYGGFWIDRPCYATDSHLQTAIRLDDWSSFLASLRSAGISHVVISDQQFSAARHGFSFRAGRNEYPFSRRLVDRYGDKLQQFDHLQFYRLRLDDASTETAEKQIGD